jgi:glycine cleavage system H protein
MPISGEIIEFNKDLEDAPEKVNEDPYNDGWMIKVRIENLSDVDSLLSSKQYQELIG